MVGLLGREYYFGVQARGRERLLKHRFVETENVVYYLISSSVAWSEQLSVKFHPARVLISVAENNVE